MFRRKGESKSEYQARMTEARAREEGIVSHLYEKYLAAGGHYLSNNIKFYPLILQYGRTFVTGMRIPSHMTAKRLFLNIKKRDRFQC